MNKIRHTTPPTPSVNFPREAVLALDEILQIHRMQSLANDIQGNKDVKAVTDKCKVLQGARLIFNDTCDTHSKYV